VAGVTVLALVALVAVNVWGNASSGAGGAAAGVGQATGPAGGQNASGLLPVGTAAPDLSWTLDGQTESIAGLQGHPVLLEFFAVWCPHCQAEAPVLSRIAERYAAQGLRVIGVSASPLAADQRSPVTAAGIQAYAERYDARFPQLFDPNLIGARRYGVRSFPTLYVLDANGVIRYADSGEVPEATLASVIDPLVVTAGANANTANSSTGT
jgi:thiol-disulfide isomerase/thioredoxin